jgi:hypothetical protein
VSRRIGKHKNIVVFALLGARLAEFRLVVVQVDVLAASVSFKPRIIYREEFWSQRIRHGGFLDLIWFVRAQFYVDGKDLRCLDDIVHLSVINVVAFLEVVQQLIHRFAEVLTHGLVAVLTRLVHLCEHGEWYSFVRSELAIASDQIASQVQRFTRADDGLEDAGVLIRPFELTILKSERRPLLNVCWDLRDRKTPESFVVD